jgi:hypothetical protein
VYANSITKTEQNGAGEDMQREIHFLKGYTVFNVEQIEGLPEQYYVKPEPKFTTVERIAHAEAFFASTRADIRYRDGCGRLGLLRAGTRLYPDAADRELPRRRELLCHARSRNHALDEAPDPAGARLRTQELGR